MTLPTLPAECRRSVCAFLPLRDVLLFGLSSKEVWDQVVLPDLCRRRKKMVETFSIVPASDGGSFRLALAGCGDVNASSSIRIPTVREQIRTLSRVVPSTHSLCDDIHRLHDSLLEMVSIDDCSRRKNFHELFAWHCRATREMKLHARIWSSVFRPLTKSAQRAACGGTTVQLDQYIGDVLIVAHLFNHSFLKLAEGSNVIQVTRKPKATRTSLEAPKSSRSYHALISAHADILRMHPWTTATLAQQEIVKIKDQSIVSSFLNGDPITYHCDCNAIADLALTSITFVVDRFGPLGPTFRGRDVVQTSTLNYRDIVHHHHALCELPPGLPEWWQDDEYLVHRVLTTSRRVIDWILLLHSESQKTRPLSTRAPCIRF
jgi:hypothetical protein